MNHLKPDWKNQNLLTKGLTFVKPHDETIIIEEEPEEVKQTPEPLEQEVEEFDTTEKLLESEEK